MGNASLQSLAEPSVILETFAHKLLFIDSISVPGF
jgi:hypothetical protein